METIKIVILSNDKKLAEQYMCSINFEMKYFQEQLTVITISNIEELKKVKNIKLLIYIINDKINKLKETNKGELKNRSEIVIIIDKTKRTIQKDDTIFSIGRYKDDRAIAFSVVWEYLNDKEQKCK